MNTFEIDGYKITVFESSNGKSMYIDAPNGKEIWKHKFTGDAVDMASWIISRSK